MAEIRDSLQGGKVTANKLAYRNTGCKNSYTGFEGGLEPEKKKARLPRSFPTNDHLQGGGLGKLSSKARMAERGNLVWHEKNTAGGRHPKKKQGGLLKEH